MTSKHYVIFLLWRLYQRIRGFKIGTIVKIWSQEKNKYIKGCISTISGDSITDKEYDFYFGANLFEPLQGNDSRYYSWGSYYPKDFKFNPTDNTYYTKEKYGGKES